ncbi:MAG TPA: hypothetical protein PLQ52_10025 [Lacunisphaera sp.]|nr:hypothetical protein [Lacunisphaera sp.]
MGATPAVETGYAAARRIWKAGGVEGEGKFLAMNFAMDRSDANWRKHLSDISAKSGACDVSPAIIATSKLSGRFSWTCTAGIVEGNVLLAPTSAPQIQALGFQLAPKP